MADKIIRIGTRESPLATWQARQVQQLLSNNNIASELVFIKSEGDTDLITPLYALGVQGIFTKTLDAALLNNRIDVAVHSLKDVPVQMAEGIKQAAVLKRGPYSDIFVFKEKSSLEKLGFIKGKWTNANAATLENGSGASSIRIATSSVRRIAQWLHRYPGTVIENLRGNVNTRLRKLDASSWDGAVFAAAGLERIGLRPPNAVDLTWMLPAPAQGSIAVVCRKDDKETYDICSNFNDAITALCVKIERDFLKTLMGGCSTPISALAVVQDEKLVFKGNVLSIDGSEKFEIEKTIEINAASETGCIAGEEILLQGAGKIVEQIRNAAK